MRGKTLIIVLFAIATGLVSCKKDDDSEQIALENRVFEAYLQNNSITAEPRESGLYFIEETEGTGLSPTNGDYVLIKHDLYLINGETLIYTTDREKASDFGIFDKRIIYGPSKTKVGGNLEGFDEGLMLMKEGGKATLLFKSDLGYGDQTVGRITPYSSLKIDLELIMVIKDPIAHEDELIADYLEKNNFTDVKPTSSGLYFISIEEGTGDSAQNNFFVTINVDGFLIDGRRFLDEEVFRFRLGAYDYALTYGLMEGVSYMKEQGKAKLIVPYNIGYGTDGKSYYEGKAKVPIPPYTTLIYDVELLNAK
jgi:peptidylprolyl isomerase